MEPDAAEGPENEPCQAFWELYKPATGECKYVKCDVNIKAYRKQGYRPKRNSDICRNESAEMPF